MIYRVNALGTDKSVLNSRIDFCRWLHLDGNYIDKQIIHMVRLEPIREAPSVNSSISFAGVPVLIADMVFFFMVTGVSTQKAN